MRIRTRWALIAFLPVLLALAAPLASAGGTDADDCPDAWITTKIGTKLTFKGLVKIDVSTEQCVVTLRGCTKTEEKKKEAIKAAKGTKYVKEVEDKITLCPDDEGDGR